MLAESATLMTLRGAPVLKKDFNTAALSTAVHGISLATLNLKNPRPSNETAFLFRNATRFRCGHSGKRYCAGKPP